MRIEIGENKIGHGASCLVRAAANVRGERDVVKSEKRFRHPRLILEDIQRRATDRAVRKRFDQRLLIHERTARHIDEHTLRSKRLQHIRIDDMARFGGGGGGDDQHVAIGSQRFDAVMIIIGDIATASRGVGNARIKTLKPLCDRLADAAEAEKCRNGGRPHGWKVPYRPSAIGRCAHADPPAAACAPAPE